MSEQDQGRKANRRTYIALGAGIAAALAFPLLATGRVIGLWGPNLALIGGAFLITLIGMITAIALGLRGVLKRGERPWSDPGIRRSLVALALGVIVAIPVGSQLYLGFTSPPIHDITTDTENPPEFVSLLAERKATNAPNSAVYDPDVAAQQKTGYPDLGPLHLDVPPERAFSMAVDAVNEMGWRLAAAVPEEGRIEAVDTTFWSGFVDDVVIRITPAGDNQSRIDVRSLSRVGGGDVGKNAARIEEYLEHLN